MQKLPRFTNSIFTQAALIIIGFTLASLVLSSYLYRESMRIVAIKEVENKATIFLSAMETSVRRLVKERDTRSLAQLIEERAALLQDNMNFAIVRVMVRNRDGKIVDHTRPEKIGETYVTDDFLEVIESGSPLIKHELKTLKLVPGKPEVPVIEVIYPITNRQKGDIQAVLKITISVERSFALIQQEYKRFTRRVILGFAITALLMAFGTLFFLRKRIIKPILSIAEGATTVASGDLSTRLKPTGSNEISALMQSFNQMVEGLEQRDQMRKSLEIAKEVQQNLLPKTIPTVSGLDIAGDSIYCDETGGDYYDFIEFGSQKTDTFGVVIGDVSGHGVSSALLMATARAFLRQRAALPGSIADIVTDVNRQLTRDVAESGSFMSMFYMEIDNASKNVNWVRAGHDPAIFYDPADDTISELKGPGIALGVDKDYRYEANSNVSFSDGQIIMLGTDGIWEARNAGGEMFGKDPVYTILKENAQLDAHSILNKITKSLADFQSNAPAEDDITLIIIKVSSDF